MISWNSLFSEIIWNHRSNLNAVYHYICGLICQYIISYPLIDEGHFSQLSHVQTIFLHFNLSNNESFNLCILRIMHDFVANFSLKRLENRSSICHISSSTIILLQHVPKINGEIPSIDEAISDHQRLIDRYTKPQSCITFLSNLQKQVVHILIISGAI